MPEPRGAAVGPHPGTPPVTLTPVFLSPLEDSAPELQRSHDTGRSQHCSFQQQEPLSEQCFWEATIYKTDPSGPSPIRLRWDHSTIPLRDYRGIRGPLEAGVGTVCLESCPPPSQPS